MQHVLSSHAFGTTPKNRCDQPTSDQSWIQRQFLYFSKPGIVTRQQTLARADL